MGLVSAGRRPARLWRLWASTLGRAMKLLLSNYGNPYPPSTASAIAYTDLWAAYGAVFPRKRHRAVGKEPGKTSYIVRASAAEQNASTTS